VARRSRHVRRFEWVLCVAPAAAGGGRLNSQAASSLGDPSPFPLRGAHCGPRCSAWCAGPSPGPGVSPHWQARRGPPAESAAKAGLWRGGAGAYVRALVWPAAGRQYPGDWGFSPARSRRPFHRGLLRVGVRVGLLVPKANEGPFKLEAGFAPAARSAVAVRRSRGASLRPSKFSGPCLSSRKIQSHGGVQAPRRG
jgi:hypothetical protein